MKVIQLHVVKQQRAASKEALWQRWVELDAVAKATLRIEDGLAAGKAYAEFCASFVPAVHR